MNKIDFALVISAERCNPNGDPLNGNRPRTDFEGHGIISDVCLKRKIRNRLIDAGENVLIRGNAREPDGFDSIKERVHSNTEVATFVSQGKWEEHREAVCRTWIDVRAFGQVFSFKKYTTGTSREIRGPVSIQHARSLDTVDIMDIPMTRFENLEEDKKKKESSTMGMKYVIDKGVYVAYGSIYPQLAKLTGFSEEDAEKIKEAMRTIFENDASVHRPSGSMSSWLCWWEHSCEVGKASPARVHRSLKIRQTEEWPYFEAEPEEIEGVSLSIYS